MYLRLYVVCDYLLCGQERVKRVESVLVEVGEVDPDCEVVAGKSQRVIFECEAHGLFRRVQPRRKVRARGGDDLGQFNLRDLLNVSEKQGVHPLSQLAELQLVEQRGDLVVVRALPHLGVQWVDVEVEVFDELVETVVSFDVIEVVAQALAHFPTDILSVVDDRVEVTVLC